MTTRTPEGLDARMHVERGRKRRRRWWPWLLVIVLVLVVIVIAIFYPRNHVMGEAVHVGNYTIIVLDSHTMRTIYYDIVTNGTTSHVESPFMSVEVDVSVTDSNTGAFIPIPGTWFIVDRGMVYDASSHGNGVVTFDDVPATDTLTFGIQWQEGLWWEEGLPGGQTTLWTLSYAQ